MKTNWIKEALIALLSLLPILYLYSIWKEMPEQVPTHWNIKGEADNWGNKTQMIYLTLLLNIPAWILLLIIPRLDPRKKLQLMGDKFDQIRILIAACLAALAILIIRSAKGAEAFNGTGMLVIFGIFYLVLGNYMKTIRPNYFLGIRTPWTLESENVWVKTHAMAGKWWMAAGALGIILSFFLSAEYAFYALLILLLPAALIPIFYSYFLFKREKELHH